MSQSVFIRGQLIDGRAKTNVRGVPITNPDITSAALFPFAQIGDQFVETANVDPYNVGINSSFYYQVTLDVMRRLMWAKSIKVEPSTTPSYIIDYSTNQCKINSFVTINGLIFGVDPIENRTFSVAAREAVKYAGHFYARMMYSEQNPIGGDACFLGGPPDGTTTKIVGAIDLLGVSVPLIGAISVTTTFNVTVSINSNW